jgi:cell wall-associated NlpC family hydrolase
MERFRGRAAALLALFAVAAACAPAAAQVQVILGGPSPTAAPAAPHPVHAKKPQHVHTVAKAQPKPPTLATPSRLQMAIAGYALRFLGTPYVWGGMTPKGFDCSGYTWYVYRMFGYGIPRTADEQFAAGWPVASPLPGDLVFFQTYDYGASHVGIYLGQGRFVSAIAGSVQISSFGSSYFASRYIGARRFAPFG